ncbi:hypothetical protein FRC08_003800 [Ceratobasidium sp. 394]|nr:hypothetical protein FRC08_003800 [Ceratobasidium sp. 394]KAG9091068.1 hypothetical protein FS749_000103 [Ceratobasidium sp. UAMH 11750]
MPAAHHVWGRHVSEYFFSNPANAFFPGDRPVPTSRHAKGVAIPHLQSLAFAEPTTGTRAALESVLSLIRHPKELRSLDNTMLLSRCMALLRSFTKDAESGGNALFGYEFGFLCFRVIVLLIQVGILTHTSTFGAFVRQTSNLSDPQEISAALTAFVARLVLDATGKQNPRDWLLGILTSQRGGRMFLRTVGGFINTDVEFFLKAIWRDRKTFSMICSQATTSGWSFALLALGEHMQWALEDGIEDEEQWGFLQTLCFRYILTVPNPDEVFFLTHICTDAAMYRLDGNEEYYIVSLVDKEDARNVMESYIHRMHPSSTYERLSLYIVELLLGFVTQDVMLDLPDLLRDFTKVTCIWIWEETGARNTGFLSQSQELAKCAVHMLKLMRLSYYNLRGAGSKPIVSLTKALPEIDFVNLLGRLILVPTAIGSAITNQGENGFFVKDEDGDIEASWDSLLEETIRFGTTYIKIAKVSNGLLASSYPDWLKTWRCFQAEFPHHEARSEWFNGYLRGCDAAWTTLGGAFGYVDREVREQYLCAYARCQGPVSLIGADFACSSCLLVAYCNQRCQSGHWLDPVDPHREECPRLWETDTQDK